jgi:hypothetical protein
VTHSRLSEPRVLLVDLNNFARYPTVAVGLLTAILREAAMHVGVLSPLASGVRGVSREPRAASWGAAEARLRYATAMSRNTFVTRARAAWVARRHPMSRRAMRTLVASLEEKLALGCDVVLVSSYLMYFDACSQIARACAARGVPVVLGGSHFFPAEVARGGCGSRGECGGGRRSRAYLVEIVRSAIGGKPLDAFPGVWALIASRTLRLPARARCALFPTTAISMAALSESDRAMITGRELRLGCLRVLLGRDEHRRPGASAPRCRERAGRARVPGSDTTRTCLSSPT